MIYKSFATIGVFTLLSAASYAGSAPPKELYGKSITVRWTETRTQRASSEQFARNTATAVQMNIYISMAGRPFVRVTGSGFAGHNLHDQLARFPTSLTEAAPGEAAADRVEFEGRSIVMYRQFRSGARRVAIDVEGTACKATIVNGREGGKNIERKSGVGPSELLSIQIEGVSCSVREGNVFGQ